jgi:hypothetical protein
MSYSKRDNDRFKHNKKDISSLGNKKKFLNKKRKRNIYNSEKYNSLNIPLVDFPSDSETEKEESVEQLDNFEEELKEKIKELLLYKIDLTSSSNKSILNNLEQIYKLIENFQSKNLDKVLIIFRS